MTLHTGNFHPRHPLALFNLILLTLWALSYSAVSRAAAEAVGHILFVHGEVRITGQFGLERNAEKGGAVYQGDLIRTAAASSVQLRMADQGYFAVRPQSEVRLDRYQYHQTPQDSARTSILRGGLRSITGAIGQNNKKAFQIRTPVATIGIRGTDLTAFYVPKNSALYQSQPGTYLTIQQGAGVLQNEAGTQLLMPGQAAFTASAYVAPAVLSALPSLFRLPSFEPFLPGLNNIDLQAEDQRQQAAKAAALKQAQQQARQAEPVVQPVQPQTEQPPQDKQPPQSAAQSQQADERTEQAASSDSAQDAQPEPEPEPDHFHWRGHLYAGKGVSEHLLQTPDLSLQNSPVAGGLSDLHSALGMRAQEIPQAFQSDSDVTHLSAGLGGYYQPADFIGFYLDLALKRSDLSQKNHTFYSDDSSYDAPGYYDDQYDFSGQSERDISLTGEQATLGIDLQFGSAVSLNLQAQHDARQDDRYGLYNPYRLYQEGFCYGCNNYDPVTGQYSSGKLAAAPGIEQQRLSVALSIDPAPFFGLFINAEHQLSLWQAYGVYQDRYSYPDNNGPQQTYYWLTQFEQGLVTDITEAGIRLNPLFMPLDLYASVIGGKFASEGDQIMRQFEGELDGVKARLELNRGGVFSTFFSLSQVDLTGSGWHYSGYYYAPEIPAIAAQSFAIDEGIRVISAGAELKFNRHVRLQALGQHYRSTDNRSGEETADSLTSEVRLTLEL